MAEIKNINAWSYKKDNVSELIADSFPYHGGSDSGENFFAVVRSNLKTNVVRQQNGSLNINFNLQLDDVVRKSADEENFSIGILTSNSFNSFENDFIPTTYIDGELSGGTGIILSDKKLQSGFYLGETSSYFSQPRLGFTISARKKWLNAPEGIPEYTVMIVCENQKTGEKKKEEVSSLSNEKISFQGLEAYDEDGKLIDYSIYEEATEDFPWDSNVINGEINYEKESKVAIIQNRWNGEVPPEPPETYDENKIAVILLGENDEPTDTIEYFDTTSEAAVFLRNNNSNRYLVHIGTRANVNSLSREIFINCQSLVKIDIPNIITDIGIDALAGTSLMELELPDSIISIADKAFEENRSLISVNLPAGIEVINDWTFAACLMLNSIVLPENLTSIREKAFYACTALTDITIPRAVNFIDSSAFEYCEGLTTITINKPQDSISDAPWGATNAQIIWAG